MERLVRLTNAQWARLQPLLPSASKKGGRPGKPDRPMVEGMLWILRTGAPWRDLPSAYGPWPSVYTRFSRWSGTGALARLFEARARERDSEGYLIDATIVRAHQDASGAAKEGAPKYRPLTRRSVHEDSRSRRRARRRLVECFFQRIKRFRRISMRFEKLDRNFLAFLHLVSALVWLS